MCSYADLEFTEGNNYFKGVAEQNKPISELMIDGFFYTNMSEVVFGKQLGNFVVEAKSGKIYLIKDGHLSNGPIPNAVYFGIENADKTIILAQARDKSLIVVDDNGKVLIDGIQLKRGASVKFLENPVLNSRVTLVVESGKKSKVFTEKGEIDANLTKVTKKAELGDE